MVKQERPSAKSIQSICVFCGSASGAETAYAQAARALGSLLAREAITVVYGGAGVGLMNALADAALADGGRVIGVMPEHMVALERAHRGLTELRAVRTMHERKAEMARLSDGCVVLPGGIGTLDELFDLYTGAYLGLYDRPIGICNVDGYYTPLLAFLDQQVRAGFLSAPHRATLIVDATPVGLLEKMRAFRYSDANKMHTDLQAQRASA
jgi:uncharacterized protein (TIGR00730 family)